MVKSHIARFAALSLFLAAAFVPAAPARADRSRDLDWSVAIGQCDLCGGSRCRRFGDRGLRNFTGRTSRRVRPDRYRRRVQLHAKRIELSPGIISDGNVATGDEMAEWAHDSIPQLVSGSQADS